MVLQLTDIVQLWLILGVLVALSIIGYTRRGVVHSSPPERFDENDLLQRQRELYASAARTREVVERVILDRFTAFPMSVPEDVTLGPWKLRDVSAGLAIFAAPVTRRYADGGHDSGELRSEYFFPFDGFDGRVIVVRAEANLRILLEIWKCRREGKDHPLLSLLASDYTGSGTARA